MQTVPLIHVHRPTYLHTQQILPPNMELSFKIVLFMQVHIFLVTTEVSQLHHTIKQVCKTHYV